MENALVVVAEMPIVTIEDAKYFIIEYSVLCKNN